MLRQENFAEEHIKELQKNSKRDPVLLERAVYAFGLLEALARVGMPFIFKGGTCLNVQIDRLKVTYRHVNFNPLEFEGVRNQAGANREDNRRDSELDEKSRCD